MEFIILLGFFAALIFGLPKLLEKVNNILPYHKTDNQNENINSQGYQYFPNMEKVFLHERNVIVTNHRVIIGNTTYPRSDFKFGATLKRIEFSSTNGCLIGFMGSCLSIVGIHLSMWGLLTFVFKEPIWENARYLLAGLLLHYGGLGWRFTNAELGTISIELLAMKNSGGYLNKVILSAVDNDIEYRKFLLNIINAINDAIKNE